MSCSENIEDPNAERRQTRIAGNDLHRRAFGFLGLHADPIRNHDGTLLVADSPPKGCGHRICPCLIAEDRPTVANFLKDHGYHTAIIGKWHLDFQYLDPETKEAYAKGKHKSPPVGSVIPDGPLHRGFDYFHGFHHARNMEAVIEDSKVIAKDDEVNMLPRLTKKSVEYINSRAGKDEPFFPLCAARVATYTDCSVSGVAGEKRPRKVRRFRYADRQRCR